jgi:hypothetical protein
MECLGIFLVGEFCMQTYLADIIYGRLIFDLHVNTEALQFRSLRFKLFIYWDLGGSRQEELYSRMNECTRLSVCVHQLMNGEWIVGHITSKKTTIID